MIEEYTLKLEDAGKTLEVNGENPNDQTEIVIPDHSATPFPIGTQIKVYRGNEKKVTLRGETSNIDLKSSNNFFQEEKLNLPVDKKKYFLEKFREINLRKVKKNKWVVSGVKINLGLNYFAYNTQDYFDSFGHAENTQEMNAFFQEENVGVNLISTGYHRAEINWSNNGRTLASGVTNFRPSYLPEDGFSWKVEGFIFAPEEGNYTFAVNADDASDLFINDELIAFWYGAGGFNSTANPWVGGGSTFPQTPGTVFLEENKFYKFTARMEEGAGGDGFVVGWQKPSDSEIKIIPSEYFFIKN